LVPAPLVITPATNVPTNLMERSAPAGTSPGNAAFYRRRLIWLTGEVVVMRGSFGCTLFGLGAAAAAGMFVSALEASVAVITPPRGVDPASVNRTFKGDRAPALPGASRVVPEEQLTNQPKLPDGCVAEADWRGNIYSDEVAGRCVV
jgi:hypothetical protein